MDEQEVKTTKSNQFKCPSCGANMVFDVKTGNLFCSHCDAVLEVKRDKDVRERDFAELAVATRVWDGGQVKTYKCSNCGAETILDAGAIATSCPFCGSAVVVDKSALKSVKPDTVVPFEVDRVSAEKALLSWRKHRFFAPNAFQKLVGVEEMKGVYHPMWTFDGYTTTDYRGRLGKHRTRVVTRNGKTTTETYTEWFNVSGRKKNIFDDILISGSTTITQQNLDKLQPFPQNRYCVYSDEYLAGFIAGNYTVQPQDAFLTAQQRMRDIITAEVKTQYNADVVDYLNLDMKFDAKSFKYLMLPIYVAVTKFKQKLFNQYVSGIAAGEKKNPIKVAGKAPVSPLKVAIVTILGLAVVAGLVWLYLKYGDGYSAMQRFTNYLM